MGRQQKGGQQPAETEPAVLKAEGAVAQIHQDSAQQREEILQIEELEPESEQGRSHYDTVHSGAPRGEARQLGGRDLRELLHDMAVKVVCSHHSSPPSRCCSFFRRR